MQRLSTLAAALAAAATALTAHAELIDAKFSGSVQAQTNAGFVLNSPIAGEFIYDTASSEYLSFTVGGQAVAAGFASTAAMTPDLNTALYRAQLSPLLQGGTLNSTFSVDIEALNTPWPSNDAIALLTNTSQLSGNLDTLNSSFGFYTANADGSNIRSVSAVLTGLQASVVPEPASMALLLAGLAAIGVRQARRRS